MKDSADLISVGLEAGSHLLPLKIPESLPAFQGKKGCRPFAEQIEDTGRHLASVSISEQINRDNASPSRAHMHNTVAAPGILDRI